MHACIHASVCSVHALVPRMGVTGRRGPWKLPTRASEPVRACLCCMRQHSLLARISCLSVDGSDASQVFDMRLGLPQPWQYADLAQHAVIQVIRLLTRSDFARGYVWKPTSTPCRQHGIAVVFPLHVRHCMSTISTSSKMTLTLPSHAGTAAGDRGRARRTRAQLPGSCRAAAGRA